MFKRKHEDLILERINQTIRVSKNQKRSAELIAEISASFIDAYQSNNKVILFGNGESAADAQHIAAELAGRFYLDRPSLPAIALGTNTSSLTAIGNDYSFNDIFAKWLEELESKCDIISNGASRYFSCGFTYSYSGTTKNKISLNFDLSVYLKA